MSRFSSVMMIIGVVALLYVWSPGIPGWLPAPADNEQVECIWNSEGDPRVEPQKSKRLKARMKLDPAVEKLRLTDSGELVRRCELTAILDEFKEKIVLNKQPVPHVLVVYVHGWRHGLTSTDLEKFESLIQKLDEREKTRAGRRRVIGVYIAWNGKTAPFPLDFLTFWRRQTAADRIAQSAIISKLIGALENIRIQRKIKGDRIFLIGHSFGARILLSASTHVLINRVQLAYPKSKSDPYSPIRGSSDLILLLNPAVEASVFNTMDSIRRDRTPPNRKEKFNPRQEPIVVAVTTLNDWATRFAFRLGQWLGNRRTEKEYMAIGHYEDFQTHELKQVKNKSQPDEDRATDWTTNFCRNSICLQRTDYSFNNPFVIAKTDCQILDGHNGIWKAKFRNWVLELLYKVDGRLAEKESTTMVR